MDAFVLSYKFQKLFSAQYLLKLYQLRIRNSHWQPAAPTMSVCRSRFQGDRNISNICFFFISDCLFLILSRNMATRSRANITSNLCQSNYRSLEFIVNFVFHSEIISGLGSRSNMTWHKHNNFEDPKILSPHKKYHKIKIIAEKKGFHQSAI